MKLITTVFLIFISSSSTYAEKARYDFYRVYEVSIDTDVHLNLMKQILEYPDGYKFFTAFPSVLGQKTMLVVPPHKFGEWSELIEKFSLDANLKTNNLQDSLDREERSQMKRKSLDWTGFWRLEEIYEWLQNHIDAKPNDLSWFVIGTSYEGREIKGLRVNVGNVPGKPSIFYEALIHGGEWLGTTSTTYIIDQLLNDPSMASLVSQFEWYFLPVLNVDGYSYAWNTDRLWRKTRKPTLNNLLCVGSDPNRNSDVHWNETNASTNPCASNYPGDYPFSEPEMLQFSNFMKTVPNLSIYFSFHQLGQFFMIPVGYTDAPINSYQLHHDIGLVANEAIFQKTGAVYELGPIAQFFGLVSGISFDWVIDNLHPKLTYCFELRPSRSGNVEWLDSYDPKLIQPTAEEMYAATITVINEAIQRGVV